MEMESGATEVGEENPEPEEDSDLPDRHEDGIEERSMGPEQDKPEDDLSMATDGCDNSHLLEHSDQANSLDNCNEAVDNGGCENVEDSEAACNSDNSNPILCVDSEKLASKKDGGTHDNECSQEDEHVIISESGEAEALDGSESCNNHEVSQEEDSSEHYDETAAPECETEIRQNTCSESDMQSGGGVSMGASASLQAQSSPTLAVSPAPLLNESESAEGNNETETRNSSSGQSEYDSVSFTGNVLVSDSAEDAPEAELENLPCVMVANQHQSVPSAINTCEAGSASGLVHDAENSSSSFGSSSSNSGVLEQCTGTDPEIQAPECDRSSLAHSGVNSEEVSQLGVMNQQASCDNNTTESVQIETVSAAHQLDTNCTDKTLEGVINEQNEERGPVYESEVKELVEEVPGLVVQKDDGNQNGAIFSKVGSNHNPREGVSVSQFSSSGNETSIEPTCTNITNAASSDESTIYTESDEMPNNPISANALQTPQQESSGETETTILSNTSIPKASKSQDIVAQKQDNTSSSSSSSNTSQRTSPAKAVAAALFHVMGMDSKFTGKDLANALQSDDEDDLMSELDAELLSSSSTPNSNDKSSETQQHQQHKTKAKLQATVKSKSDIQQSSNGLPISSDKALLQEHNRQLLEQLHIRDEEIARLTSDHKRQMQNSTNLSPLSSHSADDLYGPQIRELEKTIAQQGSEIKMLTEKLYSHDTAAKRTVLALQAEMKTKVEQATRQYEECRKEKDMIVVKFAAAEAKNMEAKRITEKSEGKVRDAMRERDNMAQGLKAARVERQKAIANFDAKCGEVTNLHKELEKMKEAINSAEYRIKWFQNKLKDELEAHKETKGNVEKTNLKLKEAREETELIRKECQAIVKRYQESEEIKSNSLDKELKMKESELQTHLQERSDSEELHQIVKQELESLKSQHKDTLQESKVLQDKVKCLEDERLQNHSMIESYQEIMQKQKAEITELTSKLNSFSTLEDDFKRAQTMIQSLDKDMSELKVTNRDLQKDMDSCRERESKMLTLQSELSKANAMLRSENTNLGGKASTFNFEVDSLKKQVEQLEHQVKEMTESLEFRKIQYETKASQLEKSLEERTKESKDFKQKWEDEMDNTKTLKRKHTNNVKDLTRQLQQARRKLETLEGKGDGTSMGSRTNSNGSLNSVEQQQQQNQHHIQPNTAPPPAQEHPVITEQVEVDKNVLIERIVKLQRSHARKNEKLEFLGEHIQQLLEEIKKKTKIIQSYAVREEAGTLSSDDMDAHKELINRTYKAQVQSELQSLLAKKGGIMASMYSVHQQDGSMTLELSLQINKKLQAVLEDTLLKNITLKENLDTLGEEIARLSQENRRLQLRLQELECKT